MAKPLRVLCIFDNEEPRPRGFDYSQLLETEEWLSEGEITDGLYKLGHTVRMHTVCNEVETLIEEIKEFKPDVVFNLLEEFQSNPSMVPHVVCLLEIMGIPYTGSNPLALRLCKDKALTKTVLTQAGVKTPPFQIVEYGEPPKKEDWLKYPVVIKPSVEDASYGIARASVVTSDAAFIERATFLHDKTHQSAIAEHYIEGRELYASLMGMKDPVMFPLREVDFGTLGDSGPTIATFRVKWNTAYREKYGIKYTYANRIAAVAQQRIEEECKAAYRALGITGYCRIDLRLTKDNEPMILEVNPNPNLSSYEDFGQSAEKAGIDWEKLIQMILDQALYNSEPAKNGTAAKGF